MNYLSYNSLKLVVGTKAHTNKKLIINALYHLNHKLRCEIKVKWQDVRY